MRTMFVAVLMAATALVPAASAQRADRGEDRGADRADRGERGGGDRGGGGQRQSRDEAGEARRQQYVQQRQERQVQADPQQQQVQRAPQPRAEFNRARGDGNRAQFDRPQQVQQQAPDRGNRARPNPGGFGQDRNGNWNRGDNRGNTGWNGRGNDGRGGWNGNDGRGAQNWNRNWRNDRQYNWQGYRSSNRQAYRLPRYYAPYGWNYGYRRYSTGSFLNQLLFSQDYWIDDPYSYRLPPVDGPYRWVRYYDDALLVDIYTGQVVDVINGIFW